MERPTSVTTFGILNIAFGALSLLGCISTALMVFGSGSTGNNPALKVLLDNQNYVLWMKISVPLGLVSGVILIVAGIGLLKLKSWARITSIAYSIYAIIFGIVSSVITAMLLLRPLLEQPQINQSPEAAGAIGGAIGGSLGGCFGSIYPILLIIFMTRPKVVAAFRQPPSIPQ